ncbi:MAG: hypothetical protein J1E79_08000, partial [Rikenella sp.]|nr:hypothetical protein [Rikenella sp.]
RLKFFWFSLFTKRTVPSRHKTLKYTVKRKSFYLCGRGVMGAVLIAGDRLSSTGVKNHFKPYY